MRRPRFQFFQSCKERNIRHAIALPLEIVSSPCRVIVDFLAEDACVICGSHRRASPTRDIEPLDGGRIPAAADQVQALTAPVRVRSFLGAHRNRPVCDPCAAAFEPARSVGCLGYAELGRGVITVDHSVFGCSGGDERPEGETVPHPSFLIPVVAPWMTNDPVLHIIHLMKYKGITSLVQVVAGTMAAGMERLGYSPGRDAVLIPVPRYERSGKRFDHTAAMADELSSRIRLPWEPKKLRKIRSTRAQSMTSRSERPDNVKDAFEAAGVWNRNVLLVDDLVTTGSTAASCIAALTAAGARSVALLCFGRAL
jgi:predicted amidophosphoribosyltransferase